MLLIFTLKSINLASEILFPFVRRKEQSKRAADRA